MKYLIIALALMISGVGYTQSVLPLRADTVRIEKVGGSGELQIRNATRDSIGVMVNIGGGRTRFMKVKKSGDTAIIIGLDTISITGKVTVQQAINNGNVLNKHDTLLNLVQLDILGLLTPDGRVGTSFNGLDGSLEIIGHAAAASTSLRFRDLTNPTQSSQISSLDGSNLDIGSFPDPVFGQSHFIANPNGANMSHGLFPNNSRITVNMDSTIIDPGATSLLGLLLRSLPAGGSADDSVLVITSQDQVKRRASSSFGGGGISTDITLTGSGSSGSPLKVDTSQIASLRALKDSTQLILNNILILSRIEFTQGSASNTYQNDTLIGKNISTIEIGGYPIGFITRPNSVYISNFDSGTGTITLNNGVFDTGDYVKILFRTPPIYLLDTNGWPVKDSNGNYIILN